MSNVKECFITASRITSMLPYEEKKKKVTTVPASCMQTYGELHNPQDTQSQSHHSQVNLEGFVKLKALLSHHGHQHTNTITTPAIPEVIPHTN